MAALFTRVVEERVRNRLITLLFSLLSAAVAAAGVSVVFSGGAVLTDRSLLIPFLCTAALAFLSAAFPRVIGFPCVVGVGAALALLAYGLFGLSPAGKGASIGVLVVGEGGTISVRFGASGTAFHRSLPKDSSGPILVEALMVRFDSLWPLFGGGERMALTAVRFGDGSGGELVSTLPLERFLRVDSGGGVGPVYSTGIPGVRVERITTRFTGQRLVAGMRIGIYRGNDDVLLIR